ncbi:MAG: Ldh family oxidoreductase [Verrucomicrobiae bacterium]|nr:Ldh family oxidoreductase [Verrucomicrobiae bacterium]
MNTYFVVPQSTHNQLVENAYRHRGYTAQEASDGARFCELASTHGIRTHNAIKAIHLDELFGSKVGGCKPGATIEKLPGRFKAVQRWNANRKLGQSVAFEAMDCCMKMADEYGAGIVTVDNAFHYLWGGGYVINAAKKGYIAYTCCTAGTSEVVPFMGKHPTMGTNPHSWAFPTQDQIGFPICIDWATSTVAMGRVQQLAREGKQLPPGAAVDAEGQPTTDPARAKWLLFFGQHKGYGLALVNELLAAFTGSGIPFLRGKWNEGPAGEKHTPHFFFQCIKAEALSCDNFPCGRNQKTNVQAVIKDILGHGNDKVMLPGQLEAEGARLTQQHGGLLFTKAEMDAFAEMARECGASPWKESDFKQVSI